MGRQTLRRGLHRWLRSKRGFLADGVFWKLPRPRHNFDDTTFT